MVTRTRERLLWITRRLGAFAAYPLNRSQRIEVSGGVRTISFTREQRIEQLSTRSGMIIDADTSPLPSAPVVGIAEAAVALVGDSAIFGATGPMLGERYRLQVTSNAGAATTPATSDDALGDQGVVEVGVLEPQAADQLLHALLGEHVDGDGGQVAPVPFEHAGAADGVGPGGVGEELDGVPAGAGGVRGDAAERRACSAIMATGRSVMPASGHWRTRATR